MAGDHIAFVKRGIKQAHAQVRGRILQRETVRLAVPAVAIRRRKPCKRRLFSKKLVRNEGEIRRAASIGQKNLRHGLTEITAPGRGKSEADVVQPKGCILP